jgi:membrane protease YdiL (CAAX protease family)
MTFRHLLPFFALAFAITWGIGGIMIGFHEPLAARFGEMDLRAPFWKLLYHLMVYGPAISAFVIIAAIRGRAGIRSFARRLLEWRVGLRWYAVVLLGYPALRLGTQALANAVGSDATPLFAFDPWYTVAPFFLFALIDDPGAVEEIGWRGFALPLLQQRYGALGASVLLGLIWGVWHLPAFFLPVMSQSGFVFPFFLMGTVVLSILMTAIYNSTRGNVLLVFLFHGMTNFKLGAAGSSPTGMLVALTLGLAVALFLIVRGQHMGKAKFTRVLPV